MQTFKLGRKFSNMDLELLYTSVLTLILTLVGSLTKTSYHRHHNVNLVPIIFFSAQSFAIYSEFIAILCKCKDYKIQTYQINSDIITTA